MQIEELTVRAEVAEADLSQLHSELVEKTIAKAQLFEKANELEQVCQVLFAVLLWDGLLATPRTLKFMQQRSGRMTRTSRTALDANPNLGSSYASITVDSAARCEHGSSSVLLGLGLLLLEADACCYRSSAATALQIPCRLRPPPHQSVLASLALCSTSNGKSGSTMGDTVSVGWESTRVCLDPDFK